MVKHVDVRQLKNAGLKTTLPRLKILDIFERQAGQHLSAEDVFNIMQTTGENVGLATVYRVLTQFEAAGLLIRHHFEEGKAIFELNCKAHHDHIVCVNCGHVEEFYDDEIERRQELAAAALEFQIQEHALTLYGICQKKNCQRKQLAAQPKMKF
ncbi:MAG: ferric iron uptake transcriptional regulator [Methylophilaceae bacterium]|nr:ferric iron uptake transcriptional regulator [Methylophilaceae bacterium]